MASSRWYDISFSVEVENEDVFKQLFDELSLLVCDGDDHRNVDEHHCRRQWVGSYKSISEVDEGEDEATGSLAPSVELDVK